MYRQLGLSLLLVVAISVTLLGNATGVHAQELQAPYPYASSLPSPTRPSPTCKQPNRMKAISSLSLQDRLEQGYPLPISEKTDPGIDQIIHDKGVHFCSDTDRPRSLATARPAQPTRLDHGEANNRIWSGNFADGGVNLYTYVKVAFKESCIAWGTDDAYSTWAGLGGIYTADLVQAGADGVNNGFSHYYSAWVENTGGGTGSGNVFNINCNDSMWVQISGGNCMYVADLTTGQTSGERCFGPNADEDTAECIVEAPTDTNRGVVWPLSKYGTQTLSSCDVEINGGPTQYGIGEVTHDYYNMYNGSTLLSSTGAISNGDTYTMSWHAYQ